nr:reverse transcriptase domain-containing protein, chloroplastic [Tanacetum cinerariifolium]
MNTASSSGTGSLPNNTVKNPREDLKAITTRSGVTLARPSVLPFSSSKEGTNMLSMILAKDLKDDEKEALLKVLKSHKQAIAWKIFNIKGTGSLPNNTVPNPREDLKAITTRSGVTLARPSVLPFSSFKEVDQD